MEILAVKKTKYNKFLLEQGLVKIKGSQSAAERMLRKKLKARGVDEDTINNYMKISSENQIRDDLKHFVEEDVLKLNEQKSEIEKKQAEVTEKAYNLLLKGGVNKNVAWANSKLFGVFYKNFGAKDNAAFDKWFNKLDVRYNITPEELHNQLKQEAFYQPAMYFDKNSQNVNEFFNNVNNNFDDYKKAKYQFKNLKLSLPADTVKHDEKHQLTANDWQEIENNISNIYIANKINGKNNYGDNLYVFGIKTDTGNYYYVCVAINNKDNLIVTATKNTQNGVDSYVTGKGKTPSKVPNALPPVAPFSKKSSTDIIAYIKQQLNPSEQNPNIFYQSAVNTKLNFESFEELQDAFKNDIEEAPEDYKISNLNEALKDLGIKEIDENELYNKLPQDLKDAVDFIFNGEPVYNVTGDEFPNNGENLNERINEYYRDSFNNKINVDGIGEIKLDKRSIKDSIYHGINTDKVNAFKAVPYVIKNGKSLDVSKPQNNGELRYLFVAPITLKGENYYCEVIVKSNKDRQGFYIHEVELKEKLADVFSTAHHGTPTSSKSIIADLINNFNPSKQSLNVLKQSEYDNYKENERRQNYEKLNRKNQMPYSYEAIADKLKKLWDEWNNTPLFEENEELNTSEKIPQRVDKLHELTEQIEILEDYFKNGKNPDAVIKIMSDDGNYETNTTNNNVTDNSTENKSASSDFSKQTQENQENEKLIAGYSYQEVMDKLTSLYSELNVAPSEEKANEIIAKCHILEDAFVVSENPEKYSTTQVSDTMLNAYYIMNNQKIPDEFLESELKSERTARELLKDYNEKKEQKIEEYRGYFTDSHNKNIITIMSNGDKSTALHELGHLFLNGLNELAKTSEAAQIQLAEVNKWLGYSGGEYTIQQQEKFASSFEAYLYKGKAPNNKLRQVFENFKEWLRAVYKDITELVNQGAVKLDVSDFLTSGTKEFLQASLLLEFERNKKMFCGG